MTIPLFIVSSTGKLRNQKLVIYKEFRSFKHFEARVFQNDLMSVPWDVIKSFDNTEDSWNAWECLKF